jgi:hypothetical protein
MPSPFRTCIATRIVGRMPVHQAVLGEPGSSNGSCAYCHAETALASKLQQKPTTTKRRLQSFNHREPSPNWKGIPRSQKCGRTRASNTPQSSKNVYRSPCLRRVPANGDLMLSAEAKGRDLLVELALRIVDCVDRRRAAQFRLCVSCGPARHKGNHKISSKPPSSTSSAPLQSPQPVAMAERGELTAS